MKKFICILFACFSLFCCTGCKKEDDLQSIAKNLTNYEISIDFDCATKQAKILQQVDYINSSQDSLSEIKFHLYPQFFKEGATNTIISSTKLNNVYENGLDFAEFNIDRVVVNNTDQTPCYENDYNAILNVDLDQELLPNKRVEICMEYSLTLPNCNHRFGYGNETINLANFYPIACVYEDGQFNTNPYHANGDPFYSDMANYCVDITLDNQYVVASTGTTINETTNENTKTISYSAQVVRDFALVISDKFQVISQTVNNTNVYYYYFNDENAEKSLKAGTDAINTFSKLFGAFPYQNFSIVQTNFVHGGMEYPNLIMISSQIEDPIDYVNVIVHETAHQWWYAMVGNDEYLNPWLDEALTEYSTILFYDHNEGYDLTHKQMIESNNENFSLFINVYEDVLGSIDTSLRAVNEYNTEPEYTYCTYVKGTLMFESLYQVVGEKNFIKALNTYFENNKYTNTTPEDLILAFEQTYNQDLSNFFNSWLNGKVVIK